MKYLTVIQVDGAGQITALHTEDFNLGAIGHTLEAPRMSEVEFNHITQCWEAQPTRIGAAMLRPISRKSRRECIAEEIRQICAHAIRNGYNLLRNK